MRKIILQLLYCVIVRLFLRIFVGVKFDKAKFLLEEKQFIIVANHNSHLDTLTIMASLPRQIVHKVRPVAAADHFGKTKFKEKLTNYFINALLIQRKRDKDHPENDPIYRMVHALDEGYSLLLFPEGTRGEPEVQQRLKPGVSYVLLQRPQVKYVPAYMKGMGKAMPKDDNLIVPFTSSLTYGQATLIQSNDSTEILQQIEQDLNRLK
ncbi:MAG: 2-acyl-glycerophospho-ethanolamine acyltransferase [Chitinophagaceae bacterium]|nr:2-acyl-glycerophospho-ethanolamine acyltransferase [Chitinophagaceae bacterium]